MMAQATRKPPVPPGQTTTRASNFATHRQGRRIVGASVKRRRGGRREGHDRVRHKAGRKPLLPGYRRQGRGRSLRDKQPPDQRRPELQQPRSRGKLHTARPRKTNVGRFANRPDTNESPPTSRADPRAFYKSLPHVRRAVDVPEEPVLTFHNIYCPWQRVMGGSTESVRNEDKRGEAGGRLPPRDAGGSRPDPAALPTGEMGAPLAAGDYASRCGVAVLRPGLPVALRERTGELGSQQQGKAPSGYRGRAG